MAKATKEKKAKKDLAKVKDKKAKMVKEMLKPLWKFIKSNNSFVKRFKTN